MNGFYQSHGKRIFDLFMASILLLIMLPLMLLIAILLLFTFRSGIFFIQSRIGYMENRFSIIKFRTMNDKVDSNGVLLSDRERMTSLGILLRKTSLDELPQLLNVLAGNMSMVGPRPLLVNYLELYNSEQRKRHLVRPGITGLAQISGRNELTWEKKFDLDVFYVKNHDFLLDCKIIIDTIRKVFAATGISQKGEATVEPFKGTERL